jgi:hypothetical protein
VRPSKIEDPSVLVHRLCNCATQASLWNDNKDGRRKRPDGLCAYPLINPKQRSPAITQDRFCGRRVCPVDRTLSCFRQPDPGAALFGRYRIHLNPNVLGWIEVKFN